MLKAAFGFGDDVTKVVLQKDAEKNAAPVQAGKEAAIEQAAKDKTAQALQNNDIEEVRREDAE